VARKTGRLQESLEDEITREWKDPDIQREFLEDFGIFEAYKRAEAKGLIRYEFADGWDLERIAGLLTESPYRDTKLVKELASKVRGRRAGKAKLGTRGALKQTVQQILTQVDYPSFNNLLEAMENEDLMDDLFHNVNNLVPLQILTVDWLRKRVRYKTRKEEERTVSFSRLRDVVSEVTPRQ